MHRIRATLVVALLAAASLTISGPSAAGGPTSALLSVPGEGKTASLYYTDPDYDALAGLVGIETATGTGKVAKSRADHAVGPGVTVTWLIHDVMPWRVDHIYLQGEGAPWITTQASTDGGVTWDSPGVWHQPAQPAELVALLDKLGVGAAARTAGDFDGVAGATLPAPADTAPEPAAGAVPTATDEEPAADEATLFTGVWWALVGLAAGAVLAALALRRTRRTRVGAAGRQPTDEPAVEPVDEPPGVPVEGRGHAMAEDLSWPAPRP